MQVVKQPCSPSQLLTVILSPGHSENLARNSGSHREKHLVPMSHRTQSTALPRTRAQPMALSNYQTALDLSHAGSLPTSPHIIGHRLQPHPISCPNSFEPSPLVSPSPLPKGITLNYFNWVICHLVLLPNTVFILLFGEC